MTDRAERAGWLADDSNHPLTTAERQVGERLSEQDRAMYLLDMLCLDSLEVSIDHVDLPGGREGEISAWFGELKDLILALARQLAEAERERDEERQWRERLQVSEEREHDTAERYREALERIERGDAGLTGHGVEIARAALHPPDPPASPAEGSEAATEVEA